MNKTLEWGVKGNKYTLTFPKIGGIKQIEVNRQVLSNSQFYGISRSLSSESQYVADMIEIEATLLVIAPEDFWEGLNVVSFEDLDFEYYSELKKAYLEQVAPWWNEIKKELKLIS